MKYFLNLPLCGSLIKIRYHNGPVDKIKNSAGNPQCFQQNSKFGDMLAELDTEEDDLQFAMTAYGLCVLLETHGETEKVDALRATAAGSALATLRHIATINTQLNRQQSSDCCRFLL